MEWFHANKGTQISGGSTDDTIWKVWWRDFSVMPSQHYNMLGGNVGRRFVKVIYGEIQGIQECH